MAVTSAVKNSAGINRSLEQRSRREAAVVSRCLDRATPPTAFSIAAHCHRCQLPSLYFAISGRHLRG